MPSFSGTCVSFESGWRPWTLIGPIPPCRRRDHWPTSAPGSWLSRQHRPGRWNAWFRQPSRSVSH